VSQQFSIYETKAKLSQLLKIVKSGKELIITERRQPIAKIVPLPDKETFRDRLQILANQGSLLPRKKNKIKAGPKKSGALKRFLEERE